MAYLAHRLADEDVKQHYVKKAAGPYSPWSRYGRPESIAINKGYVKREKAGKYDGLVAGEHVSDIDTYVGRYPVCKAVQEVVQRFQFEKNDELELIATVDFGALDLKASGLPISVANITRVIAENPEWAPKLERAVFSDANIARALRRLAAIFPKFYAD